MTTDEFTGDYFERKRQRRHLGEKAWRRIIEKQLESGLSQGEYCRRNKIPLSTFSSKRRQLLKHNTIGPMNAREDKPKVTTADGRQSLVPVRLKNQEQPLEDNGSAKVFELVLGNNRVLRIPDNFDEKTLLRLVKAVECSC